MSLHESLLETVRELVTLIVSHELFEGRSELLAQVPHMRLDEGPITLKSLVVDRTTAPKSTFDSGAVPGYAAVHGDDGSAIGGLIVWVHEGYLSVFEYWWVTAAVPSRLPRPEQVCFGVRDPRSGQGPSTYPDI